MRVIVFGASGMVGQGVLRACLLEPDVTEVLAVVRIPLNSEHPKLRQLVHTDFTDYTAIQGELKNLDACFFCLGVTSVGRREEEYTRITYDYTLAAAHAVSAGSPNLTFAYVSGVGTDSTERGRSMWARVKGRTENALLAMPFNAYMFRPGFIQPRNGASARVPVYRLLYRLTGWLYPVLLRLTPRHVTTTEHLGRAMIATARLRGRGPAVLYSPEINRLGAEVN
ncbi:NAD-dependent epimerase/dehydratase family protein [Streptomyces fuscichromogenes]|uniref:Epimerase n=1 Tax=Streptomyces fuscichromogenes TaxID=1324013 RepID=A0A918CXP2_9ACTN|nr:NAD-dependent epimerase/dehydratase family protein [Streptomyces fuscichromogenes]GGN46168.1 epimerase [Streptomyces fuscichromogenes]